MSNPPTRSRGRVRGRARAQEPASMQPGPCRPPQQPQATGVSRPPQQVYQQRAPAPQTSSGLFGRAAVRHPEAAEAGVAGRVQESEDQGNDSVVPGGRGSVRGRRYTGEIIRTRPANLISKKGKTGTTIRLQTNYFEFYGSKDWILYQYRVDFCPDEDSTRVRRKLVGQACREILSAYSFDGTVLLTHNRISPDPMELFVNSAASDGAGEPIRITIKLVAELKQGDEHVVHFFNNIIRRCLGHMKLQLVGRNFYDPEARIEIPQYNMELWPGYLTSIRQHEYKTLLCCEFLHKNMRKDNVLMVLRNEVQTDRSNYKRNFTQTITGAVVLTDYNNRTYRIDDVEWQASPRSTFMKKDGTSISYIEYYKQRYSLRISETEQPLLISRARARELRAGMAEVIYLIPELCRMTGLTDEERNNPQMMRALADYTRLTPEGRQQRLQQFSNRMQQVPEIVNEFKRWEMTLSNNIVELSARILPQETIVQGVKGNISYPAGPDTDWTRSLRSNQMVVPGEMQSWVVVCTGQMKNDAYSFVQTLQKISSAMDFRLPPPKLQQIQDDRASTYLEGLDTAIKQYNPSFILCVVSNNRADRYAAIKKKCSVDKAIPTQVVLKRTITSKGVMSVATKVAIQINCKMGGAPWALEMPLTNMMVIGFDVCHDTINKAKSYGATVASLNKLCTRYFSAITAHSNGEELSNDFAVNILKAVKKFQELNGQPPERIMIYRDGVGEGQLGFVFKHEVQHIKNTLKDYYKDKQFKFTFIVVTKRINTRFFAGTRNPPPGTVVDDDITLPYKYDFFLVSQCVRQGTVSPTYYNVLDDTSGLDPDRIQRLTYKFTHLYYNWSGTVRVPAPCQYAHKLAFLVAQSLHRNPNPQLENLLHFL